MKRLIEIYIDEYYWYVVPYGHKYRLYRLRDGELEEVIENDDLDTIFQELGNAIDEYCGVRL